MAASAPVMVVERLRMDRAGAATAFLQVVFEIAIAARDLRHALHRDRRQRRHAGGVNHDAGRVDHRAQQSPDFARQFGRRDQFDGRRCRVGVFEATPVSDRRTDVLGFLSQSLERGTVSMLAFKGRHSTTLAHLLERRYHSEIWHS